jgi:hypothetical protein
VTSRKRVRRLCRSYWTIQKTWDKCCRNGGKPYRHAKLVLFRVHSVPVEAQNRRPPFDVW